MHTLSIQRLRAEQQPLVNGFYKSHKSPTRAPKGVEYWIARKGEIVAACCLTAVPGGFWLTGLFVAPDERMQGIASVLLRELSSRIQATVWLFCHPSLQPMYEKAGLTPCDELPQSLTERLTRYQRSKSLIAMSKAPNMNTLNIASACLLDSDNRLLIVRKRGTQLFMLPGGKAEQGETPLQTLIRELMEELGVQMAPEDFRLLGHFQAEAANEPGFTVQATVFVARLDMPVAAQAELEELEWLEWPGSAPERLAPLLRNNVLPALLEEM